MTIQTIPAPLIGKVAVVTGASRGIGEETALLFARQGCTHIAITYLSATDVAKSVISSILAIDPSIKAVAIQADVHDPNFGKHVVESALKELEVDHIDIIVSNAGLQDITEHATSANITKEKFDLTMTAQAWAPLQLSLEVMKYMPPGGRIILNSSGSSRAATGDPFVIHGASKAAMDSVARNLALIFGKDKGITVNSISIGATETDSLKKSLELFGPEFKKYAEGMSPLKRLGSPREVANIIGFVASPEASWINGNQLPANGGSMTALQG